MEQGQYQTIKIDPANWVYDRDYRLTIIDQAAKQDRPTVYVSARESEDCGVDEVLWKSEWSKRK